MPQWAEQLAHAHPTSETARFDSTRPPTREEDGEVEDSDDECDAMPAKPASVSRAPMATIRVEDAAFTTCRAVLLWLATGAIAFAPLLSKVGKIERDAYIRRYAELNPDLPLPASPRSVYILAERLGFAELSVRARFCDELTTQVLALTNYAEQLDDRGSTNLAMEAFGGMSQYPKARELLFTRLAVSWPAYKDTPGWARLAELVEAVPSKRPLFGKLWFKFLSTVP